MKILKSFASIHFSPLAMAKNILVTGGAGYIGSHTVLQLLDGGYSAVVVDNYDNSSAASLQRVKKLAGENGHRLSFHQVPFRFLSVEMIFSQRILLIWFTKRVLEEFCIIVLNLYGIEINVYV